MRQVVLDTETTGLSWEKGNRVVEIGCLELLERRITGVKFQRYLKPDCAMEQGAQEVTGLSLDFLADKPVFADVVDEFLQFISGAELIIHNAAFDVGFLNNELARTDARFGKLSQHCTVLDTLALARERFPGQRNSLDALCKRLGVDNGHRKLHGALLDAELLAEVYLALTSGQDEMELPTLAPTSNAATTTVTAFAAPLPTLRVLLATPDELAAHEARLAKIDKKSGGKLLWSSAG